MSIYFSFSCAADSMLKNYYLLVSQTKHETLVSDSESSTSECLPKKKGVLESRASVDNCAKKLFSSPGAKRSFTRHPSLMKLAKSIQDDRRKINSAPSSPVKCALSKDTIYFYRRGYDFGAC